MIDDWVRVDGLNLADEAPTLRSIQRRWCPTHRRWEEASKGERLRCGAAWAELYGIEREVEEEKISPIRAILILAENVSSLVEEIQYGERIIAEPPPRPQVPPRPPVNPMPPTRRNNGKGGVALP